MSEMREPSDLPAPSPVISGVDLHSSYFELFGIPVGYQVERSAIQGRYLQLQRIVHPDRFVGFGERGQRLAMQYAGFVNEAFATLCSPVKRALYLLELSGHPVNIDNNTVTDATFLMEQISLREQLSDVRENSEPEMAVEALRVRVETLMEGAKADFDRFWRSGESGYRQAADCVRKMHFIDKILSEVQQLADNINDL